MTSKNNSYSDKKRNAFQHSLFDKNNSNSRNLNEIRSIDDEERDRLLLSLLAIYTIDGIGYKTLREMNSTKFFDDFWDLNISEIKDRWDKLQVKPRNDFSAEIFNKKKEIKSAAKELVNNLKSNGITFIPTGHKYFPNSLLRLANPPQWIFVKGNIATIHNKPIVGVVGTRDFSNDGKRTTYNCAKELVKRNITVLSGLAKGVDETAHQGAVDYYGQTIAILGYGLTTKYASNKDQLWNRILETDGAIISEFFPDTPPSKERFLRRNELQAAMSDVLIPVECPNMNSGTGATIRRAKLLNTPIIGIIPSGSDSDSIKKTKKNLIEMDIPVFEVFSESSDDFWEYLHKLMPDHDWVPNKEPRQDRFLSRLEDFIVQGNKKVPLDGTAIDRAIKNVKQKIENQDKEDKFE